VSSAQVSKTVIQMDSFFYIMFELEKGNIQNLF